MNASKGRRPLRRIALFTALPFLVAEIPSSATEFHLSCPPKISHDALRVQAPPPGWMAGTQGALLLTAAAPMDGPPARSITLIPDSSDERDGTEIDRWQFAGEFPDGKFISCAYGSEGVVLLAKRIDDRTTGCEVIYKKHQGKLAVNDIVCKMP